MTLTSKKKPPVYTSKPFDKLKYWEEEDKVLINLLPDEEVFDYLQTEGPTIEEWNSLKLKYGTFDLVVRDYK